MKRTFLSKRNALFASTGISWNVGVLFFALIVLFVRLLMPNLFWIAFTPLFKSANALSAQSHFFLQHFSDAAALASKNEQLMSENASLASENQALSQKISSISAIKDVSTGILAGVVARPPESPYDTIVIAAGSDNGVSVGMEVFGSGGVPVGVVSTITDNFSRATLFSSPNMNTLGWVGRNSMTLSIVGAGAGSMNATVSRSADIVVGDIVFVPGPGMLPIGTVTRVDSDSSSPSVALRIQPILNPFSLSWVLVRDTGMTFSSATSSPL
ncbi:MAG: rod shape-determining protein MreC [Candidatus Paceibacterota bacterium]|jgi:cell shape-determining protein MreC